MNQIPGFWKKIKSAAGRVSFVRHAVAMFYALRDPFTPAWAKAIIVGALVYFVAPADVVPDWIAGLGFTDDAAVVASAVSAVARALTQAHYSRADEFLRS